MNGEGAVDAVLWSDFSDDDDNAGERGENSEKRGGAEMHHGSYMVGEDCYNLW